MKRLLLTLTLLCLFAGCTCRTTVYRAMKEDYECYLDMQNDYKRSIYHQQILRGELTVQDSIELSEDLEALKRIKMLSLYIKAKYE